SPLPFGCAALIVQTDALSKQYGRVAALVDCSLGVERGEILGLLGPNGAGKTTLLRLLLGYLRPTAGRATIDGLDCYRQSVAVRRQASYLPGDARLFRGWDGWETLQFFARLRPGAVSERAVRVASRLELDLKRRVGQMSTGMRQKLALAVTLAPPTPLVILDEPTANLDPTVRQTVIDLIRESRAAGQTVLFSSHVLSEVEEACDRVVVLSQGRLVDSVRVAEVRRQHRIRAKLTGTLAPPPAELSAGLHIEHAAQGDVTMLATGELAPLLGWLGQQPLASLEIEPVGLRTVYERHHGANGR
ncbi:MAG TPA: ABC transporter ATP-binding protein, partial [Lacipirellulaceae bacterium]|nr:ABC transporter ATP-binding protein [Lacipirellulaceae bacterium]